MVSTFGWLDTDSEQRRRMLEVVDLFKEEGTVDELGIGSIRDALADSLFPGTSVLHTRLRYVLFIPWLMEQAAHKPTPTEMSAEFRSLEYRLINSLLAGGERQGVIGNRARASLKRMPSGMYWASLGAWQIRQGDFSADGFFRRQHDYRQLSQRTAKADDPEARELLPGSGLDRHLPSAPAGWLKAADFALTPDEEQYLSDQIATATEGSMLAWLVRNPPGNRPDFVWEVDNLHRAPQQLRDLADHSRRFSIAIHGAALVYNLLLARRSDRSDPDPRVVVVWSACETTRVPVLLGESRFLRLRRSRLEDTLSVRRVRRGKTARKYGRQRVRIGASDPSLTATSGVAAVAEFLDRLDVVGRFDRGIGPIKKRVRGASAGELLIGMAQSQLLGADALVALDRQRADVAAVELSGVPVLASTTAAGLARRFGPEQLAGIEAAVADLAGRAVDLLPVQRRVELEASVTVDLDSTDVEVYGSKKQGVAYNYQGQRAGRPHLATWAEAGLTTAADLLAGNDDVRPRAADMLRRGLAGIPASVRVRAAAVDRLRTRVDAGYFTADLAHAAVEQGCDFAIAAKRNTAMWRAYASIQSDAWVDAMGMPGAQVAALDYAPAGWPADTYTIVRRVRVEAETISADPSSRRRRTIDKDQLALALEGTATHAYAVSFIVTNIPANDRPGDTAGNAESILEVEAWFRRRTDIEDRIREAKLGAALRKLPSGDHAVNTVWMWAALLAGNLSALLQALTGIDQHGRAHGARLRHELLCVPARLVRHGRRLTLRLPPGDHLLPIVLTRIRQLHTAA